MSLRYQDVFIAGGLPSHTYNPRPELNLENRLEEANENLCKLVTVVGQTKSGKTVLARTVFPPQDAVWVDGGTVSDEDDFWGVVLEQLDLFQSLEREVSDVNTSSTKVAAKGGVNVVLAKGSAEVGGEVGSEEGAAERSSRTVSAKVAALAGLKADKVPLVVDDFHYLPRALQGSVVRALKALIFEGFPVVIIAIPHRRFDAIRVEKEMTGRAARIEVPSWSEEDLKFIPRTGFELLDIKVADHLIARLAAESIGSPHLMQEFCREVARAIETGGVLDLESIFRSVADEIGRPIFDKLAKGPRPRSDRIARQLKNGREVDIYELVLHALANLKPGLVSLEYEDVRTAIRNVSASLPPQLHEVARVLKHMATIAASDQSSTPVIDFEEAEKKLHITDPFFAFYLRWGRLD